MKLRITLETKKLNDNCPLNLIRRDNVGVKKLISLNKNKEKIKELVTPYIHNEIGERRELHFKNTCETGKLIEQFINYKMQYRLFSDANYKFNFTFQPSLSDYMFYGKYYYGLENECDMINSYFNRFNKRSFNINEIIFNDINKISEYVLNQISNEDYRYQKYVYLDLSNEYEDYRYEGRKGLDIRCKKIIGSIIQGNIDYINKNGIYDLKCTTTDNKYDNIIQILCYLCMYLNCEDGKDVKVVKIINPILNRNYYIDVEEFGVRNIRKFFELIFSEYLEDIKFEIRSVK